MGRHPGRLRNVVEPRATRSADRSADVPVRDEGVLPWNRAPDGAGMAQRGASLQRIHDLQFTFPAFMGQQHRDKVLDPNRLPINDQDDAAVAV